MSEKISQRIMLVELILIILPSSILSLMIFVFPVDASIDLWANILVKVVGTVTCVSGISEIILLVDFIFDGAQRLQKTKPTLWIFSSIGLIIAIIGFISILNPAVEFGSTEEYISTFFLFPFFYGLIMFVPYIHLIIEKQFRKTAISTNL